MLPMACIFPMAMPTPNKLASQLCDFLSSKCCVIVKDVTAVEVVSVGVAKQM